MLERIARAHGTSLWLVPDRDCSARFGQLIEKLSRRLGTVRFDPHVTLLGSLGGDPSEVAERAGELAKGIAPLRLRWLGPGHRPEYFRAFFLEAERSGELVEARQRAARHYGREPDANFLPHLSLVYGQLDAETLAQLSAELRGERTDCVATRLDVVRTQGPPSAWRPVASYCLD